MSEAKFTKGEWVSGMHYIKDAEDYNVECGSDCGWSYIGTKNKCIAMAVTKSHLDAELDANTALIAAAPEMYQLLHDLSEMNCYELAGFMENSDELIKLLAKARGEK